MHLLKPICRLLIGKGYTYGVFSELIKAGLVQSAINQLNAQSIPLTDSRISLITGLHRKDVKRLRESTAPLVSTKDISISAQVIALWAGNSRYSENGKPKLLPKKSANNQPDFETLVTTISKDIRPRTVLDELAQRKVISILSNQGMQLHLEKIAESQDEDSILKYMSMNIHDHFQTCVGNYLKQTEPQLDKCAFYQGLSKEAAEDLAKFSENLAINALLSVNKKAHELMQDEKNHGQYRTNFGLYFYKEHQDENAHE